MMREPLPTKLSYLAYLIVLSLLIIFLLLATAGLWGKAVPYQRLLLSALLFGLGYLACLFLSKLIFSPLGRLVRRSTNPGRDKSLKGVQERETAHAGSSLSQLTEDLRLSREEVKRWNRELEHRVEERTRELSEAQERLIQSARLASSASVDLE